MKVLILHHMEKWWPVRVQFLWSLSKQARVILLELLRVSHPHMKLHMSCSSYTCPINWHFISSSWVSNSQAKPLDYECGTSDIRVRTASSLLSQSNSDASHNYWYTTRCYSTKARRKPLAICAKKGESSSTKLGGKQHKNEKECAYWKGELCAHIYLYLSFLFFFFFWL